MASMNGQPTSAEVLVRQFYDPAYSSEAVQRQKYLQHLQRSSEGWRLAEELSNSTDTNVRFFAALTFTVKLNQDGASLDEEQLSELQTRLLVWLLQLISQNESLLVIRKLCSTLVTLYVLPESSWRRCIRQLICCLSSVEIRSEESIDQLASSIAEERHLVTGALPHLSLWLLFVVLIFATTLAEDGARIDHNSQRMQYAHERIESNIDDVVDVLQYCFSILQNQSPEFVDSLFNCLLVWIAYAKEEFRKSNQHVQRLQTLLRPTMQLLTNESTFESTALFFTDLFTTYEDFVSKDDLEYFRTFLSHPSLLVYMEDLEQSGSPDEAAILFGTLVLAYGTAAINDLIQTSSDSNFSLRLIHRITRTQSYETVDQTLSNAIVDFWEAFVLSQSPQMEDDDVVHSNPKASAVESHWLQALGALCQGSRLEFDETGEFLKVSSDDPFFEFRSRVRDAAQSSVEVFPLPVLDRLVTIILSASEPTAENAAKNQTRAWDAIESALNCLVGIADGLHYQPIDEKVEDEILQKFFGSFLYQDLANPDVFIPLKIRRSAIHIVGEHDEFLKRHPEFLLSALDILFKCLEHETLMESSATAIYNLCDPNRSALNGVVDQFTISAEQFFLYPLADGTSKESVAGALAAVIQGLPESVDQGRRTEHLLTLVESCFREEVRRADAGEEPIAAQRVAILSTLRQLKAIGRAFQTPNDAPINLDSDDENENAKSTFWTSAEAQHIRDKIVQFVRLLYGSAPDDENILEAACDTIKSGYRELEPGPFVLAPQVTTDLIISIPFNNPRLDLGMSAAHALLNSSTSNPSRLNDALPPILSYTCALVRHIRTPHNDPETAGACLEFLSRLVTRWLSHLTALSQADMELLLDFSLLALHGPDVLPKRSAALMWSFLLSLKDEHAPQSNPNFREQLVSAVGPRLTLILVNNIGGNCLRSDLDTICEPFKKLVAFRFSTPNLPKEWIDEALFKNPTFPSGRVTEQDKRRFVQQVLAVRGGPRTAAVVKEFWQTCRGAPVAYS